MGRTALGPVARWSPALRITVENLLGNGFIETLAEDVHVSPSRGYGTQLRVVLPVEPREGRGLNRGDHVAGL